MGNLLPLMPFCLPPITRRKGNYSTAGRTRTRSRTGRSEEAAKMANSNQIPKLEHGASETALRVLWKFVKNHDSESDVELAHFSHRYSIPQNK